MGNDWRVYGDSTPLWPLTVMIYISLQCMGELEQLRL